MITSDHAHLMARYNEWMNARLYALCATLPDAELRTAADWCLQRPAGPGRTAALAAMAERAGRTDAASASGTNAS